MLDSSSPFPAPFSAPFSAPFPAPFLSLLPVPLLRAVISLTPYGNARGTLSIKLVLLLIFRQMPSLDSSIRCWREWFFLCCMFCTEWGRDRDEGWKKTPQWRNEGKENSFLSQNVRVFCCRISDDSKTDQEGLCKRQFATSRIIRHCRLFLYVITGRSAWNLSFFVNLRTRRCRQDRSHT